MHLKVQDMEVRDLGILGVCFSRKMAHCRSSVFCLFLGGGGFTSQWDAHVCVKFSSTMLLF